MVNEYLVWIELHDFEGDYLELHVALFKAGYLKTLLVDGKSYKLPRELYVYSGNGMNNVQVSLGARRAVSKVTDVSCKVIVLKSDGNAPAFLGIEPETLDERLSTVFSDYTKEDVDHWAKSRR